MHACGWIRQPGSGGDLPQKQRANNFKRSPIDDMTLAPNHRNEETKMRTDKAQKIAKASNNNVNVSSKRRQI
jgi:hypothetical protein